MQGRRAMCRGMGAVAGFAAWVLGLGAAAAWAQSDKQLEELRNKMVDEEIVAAGVKNKRVIESLRTTPRHEFVTRDQRKLAYYDMALPIGESQTISPPFVVAYMTEQLDPQKEDKVLEIGTGSGYQAAVLSPLVKEVYSIEIVGTLGRRAAATLKRLSYANVFTKVGDGYQGWAEHAPFDKIIVTCSPENVPQPLIDQLREGGRMVIPLGERYQQALYLYRKKDGKLEIEALKPTLFVPMTGTAEGTRKVLPDPKNPSLYNASCEETIGNPPQLAGWHYQRQAAVVKGEDAPDGEQYLKFSNTIPGRDGRALQGFAVDGRFVRELQITLWVKGDNVRQGQTAQELPLFAIVFYDEERRIVDQQTLGPWRGSFEWQQVTGKFTIAQRVREGIVRVGMFGAMGEFCVDNMVVRPVR